MPNEYVTREDAVSAMKGELCDRHCSFGKPVVTVTGAEHRIMQLPAADVAPVVHARWVKVDDDDHYCSHCLTEACDVDVSELDYCPKCGARMDGGKLK